MTAIDLEPPDDESRRLWSGVGDLVDLLPAEWVLIGGLMVQLHALELGVRDVRVTTDVDLLAQARPPGPLAKIDAVLQANGFEAQHHANGAAEPNRRGIRIRVWLQIGRF